MNQLKEIVSRNIRSMRLEEGLTQQEVADRTGFKVAYISRLEGNPQNISLEILEKLAKAFGKSVVELVASTGTPHTSKRGEEIFREAMRLLAIFQSKLRVV